MGWRSGPGCHFPSVGRNVTGLWCSAEESYAEIFKCETLPLVCPLPSESFLIPAWRQRGVFIGVEEKRESLQK
jgi:hypothetical protein